MLSIKGFSLVGKNLLPIALEFKNYKSNTVDASSDVSEMDQDQLINWYREITGESEKDICELAGKAVTLENIRILVHLTINHAQELKLEALEDLEKNAAQQDMDGFLSKRRKKAKRFKPDQFLVDMAREVDDMDKDFLIHQMTAWFKKTYPDNREILNKIEHKMTKPADAAQCMVKAYTDRCEEVLNKVGDVKLLPVEDTIWLISEICKLSDQEGNSEVFLIVQDSRSIVVGYHSSKQKKVSLTQQCHDLITISALNPLDGTPRRPRSVTCKEPSFAERVVGLDLTDVGIRYMYAGVTAPESSEYVRMRQCCMCFRRGSKGLFKKCSSCQSMLYCSRACQKEAWSMTGDMAQHSHKLWCKKIKMYMSRTAELCQFPFTFSQETSSENFDIVQYKQFLEKEGVYNTGFWRREARLPGLHEHCQCCVSYGDISNCDDGIVLPVESTLLSEPPENEMTQAVSDWYTYYQYRGLRLDSPVAILLQWPLTLYFVVKYCLPNDYSEWWDGLDGGSLLVDILGVEKEVEMLDLFKELEYLLPDVSTDIMMYGVEISSKVNNKQYQHGKVKIKVRQGLYHRKADQNRKPNLVIGYNAGLGAYKSWSQTLVKLRTDKTPAYFTDYCQCSCECAKIAVEKLGIGTVPKPLINPFRSPVRKLSSENDMPWFSNGFIYHLVYP